MRCFALTHVAPKASVHAGLRRHTLLHACASSADAQLMAAASSTRAATRERCDARQKKRCVDATARANFLRAHALSMPSTRAHRRVERVFRHRARTRARDTRAPQSRSSATCVHVAQIACRAQAISNVGWNDVRASMMQTPSACMPMHDDRGRARRRRACSAQRRRRHGRRSPAERAAHRKQCSATTENRVQLRLKRGRFTTIEELLYGHFCAVFAAWRISENRLSTSL